MKFDAFGTSKHGEEKSLSKTFFALLMGSLGRFNRANKKVCHIHFKVEYLIMLVHRFIQALGAGADMIITCITIGRCE